MKYLDFIRRAADELKVSDAEARRIVNDMFFLIRDIVLVEEERVVIPRFGTFRLSRTSKGVRKVGDGTIDVPASIHVRFRSSKGAKERVE